MVDKFQTGMQGVFLVAAELTYRKFIVSVTSRNAFGADLLVTDRQCQKAWSVQVKTSRQVRDFWLVGEHARHIKSSTHVYVFVNLRENDQRPEYHALELLTKMDKADMFSPLPSFVASFSEDDDLLSQWRGYCPSGGFALCFSFDRIRQLATTHGWVLRQCLYSKREQDAFLADLEESALAPLPQFLRIIGLPPAVSFANKVALQGLTLKHSKFKEEKEWRAFAWATLKEISCRKGKSSLIPYINFPLTPNTQDVMEIDSLVISPTPDEVLSKTALNYLLASKGVQPKTIKHSQIPYRHW